MLIGKVEIKTPIILAPMAGVTDYPFRVLCRKMGAGAVYSEFVSSEGIIRENQKTHIGSCSWCINWNKRFNGWQ